jgi:hypothetical protein
MKKSAILVICLLAVVVVGSFAQSKKKRDKEIKSPVDEMQEVESVKAAIDRESQAFFGMDYSMWAESWAHVPYAYWSFADTTDVNYFEGWEAIDRGFKDYFKTSSPSKAKMNRTYNDVRVYGNAAYARFTQKVEDDLGRDEQVEVRMLEKHDGMWKIVYVGVIARQKERPTSN